VTDEQPERLDYESALRVIGRHLDAEPTYNVSVLEVNDGFTVRTQQTRARSDAHSTQFTWDRLNHLVVFHVAGRGCARRRPRHSGIWANFPNGHEDFFRALGHQLDAEHGSGLSVEEMAHGVEVSYYRPAPSSETEREKSSTLLAFADIETMLEQARTRRNAAQTETSSSTQS
jgi:hypothetical protein